MIFFPQAIDFAKEQDDEDLWDDLINYSLDKPGFHFILYCFLTAVVSFASVFRDVTQREALCDIPKDPYHLLELAGPKELR